MITLILSQNYGILYFVKRKRNATIFIQSQRLQYNKDNKILNKEKLRQVQWIKMNIFKCHQEALLNHYWHYANLQT